MPAKIYHVRLSEAERTEMEARVKKGEGAGGERTRTQILLLADEEQEGGGRSDGEIAKILNVSVRTVERARENCVKQGITATVKHAKPVRTRSRKLDGAAEAELSRLACTQTPDGQVRWTVKMLRDKLVELEVVDNVSKETVRKTLKKMNLNHG